MVALRAVYGLPIRAKASKTLLKQCTGRNASRLPKRGFDVSLFLTGRRSGKSRCSSALSAQAAVLAGLEKRLAKGEKGLVPIICPTKQQGRIIKNYLRAIFEAPMLHACIEDEQRDGFSLTNNVRIEILPGDFRHVRGYTILTAVIDEAAFLGLEDDSRVRSDTELVRALLPALATCRGRLIAISSPYAKKGWTWQTYKKNFGNDKGRVLVWQAPSRTMNPTLPQRVVDEAMAEDRASAMSEYMAIFRDDVGIFIPREVVEALVVPGRFELTPRERTKYRAFVDVSGGRSDGSALAIGHKEDRKAVIDFVRLWRSPHNPHEVISDMSRELNRFGIRKVTGDQYAAEFVAGAFNQHNLKYVKAEKPKTQLYSELLPMLCSSEIELLDNEELTKQISSLERRTRSGGRDVIDHPPRQHDDLANAVAGCAVECHSHRTIRVGAGGF